MTLIAKPFITICGDGNWCEQIVSFCVPNLPMEPTEWVRKRGSGYKLVHVDIDAKEFNQNNFSKYEDSVLGGPLFHLFVIIENEEGYISTTRSLFGNWINLLRSRSLDNWKLIIVPDSNKPKNKFTMNKFILTNKLKSDFNLQKLESHSIKLSENSKERFTQIQKFLRETVLFTYDDMCFKIEDKIRIQRETRYTSLWNYFDFFSLQEELADIYECLNLYEESLAQFDESDAVFFNCLESYYKGEKSNWINYFKKIPFEKIDCLILINYSDPEKRSDLSKGKLCLADFRAYLLSRQCALLQLLNRYQEIPTLVYSTLVKFLNECKLLNVNIDSNLKNCWIFLTALQALQRFSPSDCEDILAQDYATLFRLALNSINKLAISLNIWTPSEIDWDLVCILREKLSILSNDEYGDTPSSRLAGGFRSQIDFQEFHSKLFEEALMIWKHIGRIRSANLLGTQLADLYYKVQQYEKAEPLYIKAIKCLRDENWAHLAMGLRLKLAVCQKGRFESDPEKLFNYLREYLKTCIHLAGATFSFNKYCFNPDLLLKNDDDHLFYYKELQKCVNILYDKTMKPQIFKMQPLFSIKNIKMLQPDKSGFQTIELVLNSHLAQSTSVKLSIEGIKFSEVNLTNFQNHKNEQSSLIQNNNDILEFPAQYSIPLSSKSSPNIYRSDKPVFSLSKSHKELVCQSSIDDEANNINSGVIIEITDIENSSEESNDKLMSLTCCPKKDAGLKARKISISQDVGFSLRSFSDNRKISPNLMKETEFFPIDNSISLMLDPGENQIILKSKGYGLYVPKSIEMSIFNDEALVKDLISEEMLDSTWGNYDKIQECLPDIIIGEYLDNFGFINFQNQLTPKIKMGLLSFPVNEIELKLFVNNENLSCQKISLEHQNDSDIFQPESTVSLSGCLDYTLHSAYDTVEFCIPNLIRKNYSFTYCEDINLLKEIIRTNSSKYLISVCLYKSSNNGILKCNYQIKNPTLKLHHQNEIRQLLPLAHRSLSTGSFSNQTQFTILWILESIDIVNFEKECLKFTLSIDLVLDISDYKQLSGAIIHDFELRNI